MNFSDYAELDAVGISTAIRKGEVSSQEVTDKAIEVAELMNPDLNALVLTNYDNARSFAAGKLPETPVSGVPFYLKDVNQFSHDMPTTFSCRFFESASPKEDSELVRRWRQAGLVFLGKTNTPEFAEDFVCEPTFRGVTLNPWNTAVTTGGSSGGAGAAVASGMVPLAHATDLGGSIRIPAACCGVFGLKPTTGLNPIGPYYMEFANGFNSDHVLSRSVRDSAAALDCSVGPLRGSRYQVQPQVDSYLGCLDQPIPKLRIGVSRSTPYGLAVDRNQVAAVELVSAALEGMGHSLCEYTYPPDLGLGSWMESLWMVDIAYEIENRIAEIGREPEHHELEALTHYLREHVAGLSAMDLYRARQLAHQVSIQVMNSMSELDLLLTPTLACDPIPVGSMDSRTENFDFDTWGEKGHAFAPFAYICNVSGQPAASLPIQLRPGEHPCAVQLAGHSCEDHLILQVSARLEQQFEWQNYRPPIWAGDLA
ncbi:MAG: amidase [Pseudomonadota bacterium]|nr:amidase [Pseudomonadota bacterium]